MTYAIAQAAARPGPWPEPVQRHVNPQDPDDMARFFAAWHWPGREMSKRDWAAIRLRMTRARISRDVPADHWRGWFLEVNRVDWRALCRRFGTMRQIGRGQDMLPFGEAL